jgi:hypothetical protein
VFANRRYPLEMTNTPTLRPATADEIAETLAFALRFEGRKRVRYAGEIMAEITADRLVAHLERSGYVVMKKPSAVAPSTSTAPIPGPIRNLAHLIQRMSGIR